MSTDIGKPTTKNPHGHLLVTDWSKLAYIQGCLSGIALGLEASNGNMAIVKSLREIEEEIEGILKNNEPVFNKPNHG